MRYDLGYLENEYEIFYDEKDNLYDVPMLWKNSDDIEEFTLPEKTFENAIPKLNNLSKLPIKDGDTIVVGLTNYIEYLASFQVWNMEEYKTEVYLTYNKFNIDDFDCFEEVADIIATWFNIQGYKDITIEVRTWETEEYTEGFIDYIENN